jgi:hypothetical protein
MNALPIIVANVIVGVLAVYTDWKQPQHSSTNIRRAETDQIDVA